MKILIILILFFAENKSFAQSELPLLQMGFGYGTGSVPDYPASDQVHARNIFLPVLIYRGTVIKSDQEEGTRAELFKSLDYKINLSFGARFSADSSTNRARKNMPSLNYVLEVGPNLRYRIWSNLENTDNLILQVPLRVTFTTNFKDSDFLGFVLDPEIRYEKNNFLVDNIKSKSSVSFEFFSERVANYFYEVEPQFQNNQRSSYRAKSGFSGINYTQSFLYQTDSWLMILGASYTDYSQSVNRDSPLYKQSYSSTYFVALGWFFYSTE
ncbi:MAG: MipA/OmpV family protein [Bdellovibrionota bacterium]